jgi:hypothetical protein
VSPVFIGMINRRPEGPALTCFADRRVCVGMAADHALSFGLGDDFGGLRQVYCGFGAPGGPGTKPIRIASLITTGCGGARYLLEFSNGRQISRIWVDSGRIVALARARHRRPPEP